MAAAIHTRYRNGRIRAWTKDGKGIMSLIVPYDHSLHHSRRHGAAAKALAEKLGWSGLWVIGHNEDNSICAVQPIGLKPSDIANRVAAVELEDYFVIPEAAR
jgi:hypothetical protein